MSIGKLTFHQFPNTFFNLQHTYAEQHGNKGSEQKIYN